ncbi:protein NipSnap homolog 3A isoform X2 [Dermochelys coriacea]|uniref:protein NipSnap homolog 3A isoform X2 n=1 Tax=Dermochelys coriacea TaxID=27794 RepID=UPI0018E8BBC7|nr:protein NipSnap homolog 3A isoform X2 [Dermochelys coriacea]
MLGLRALLLRGARGARACPQVRASLATGPRQNDGTFYEIRTYDVKPSKMKEFVEMVNKHIHLRTAHSEMVGIWTAEFGGMNKAIHIWKFDNFAHRAEVRKAVANDKEWQGKFISPVLPFLNKQNNEIVYLVPWCEIGKPSKEGGVYEMVTFQMKPGGPALWGQAFRAAINAHLNTGYTKLIGVFHTEYGLLNRVHVLWWNENPDNRAAGRHYAHEDARVVAAVRESVRFLESQQNMLLIPMPCSPLK